MVRALPGMFVSYDGRSSAEGIFGFNFGGCGVCGCCESQAYVAQEAAEIGRSPPHATLRGMAG